MGKDKMGGHERGTAARSLTQFPLRRPPFALFASGR